MENNLTSVNDIEKGGAKAAIGELRTFGGRQYIKTADGWKFHGKGNGAKAKEHAEKSKSVDPSPFDPQPVQKTSIDPKAHEKHGGEVPTDKPANGLPKDYQKKLLASTEKEAIADYGASIKDWKEFTPEVCNKGYCDIYATHFIKEHGGKLRATGYGNGTGTTGHYVVELNGKFYDAETPQGVDKIAEIPYMKQVLKVNKGLTEAELLKEIGIQGGDKKETTTKTDSQDFGDVVNNKDFQKYLEKHGYHKGTMPTSPRDLTQGLCGLTAMWMTEKHPDAKINASFVSMGLLHAVAKIDGKYYDGLDPKGVDKLEDMKFFKDHGSVPKGMTEYSRDDFKAKYDEEYGEDGDDVEKSLAFATIGRPKNNILNSFIK